MDTLGNVKIKIIFSLKFKSEQQIPLQDSIFCNSIEYDLTTIQRKRVQDKFIFHLIRRLQDLTWWHGCVSLSPSTTRFWLNREGWRKVFYLRDTYCSQLWVPCLVNVWDESSRHTHMWKLALNISFLSSLNFRSNFRVTFKT